jgi:hypothetical protein
MISCSNPTNPEAACRDGDGGVRSDASRGSPDPRPASRDCGAKARALNRFRLTVLRIGRIDAAAASCQDHLPSAFVTRLYGYAPDLMAPPRPTGGITAAQDRVRRRAVAAALAPWKRAIAAACAAAERAARAAARLAKPHAPVGVRPPRDAGVPGAHAPIPGATDPAAAAHAAARLAKPHAPVGVRPPRRAGVPGAQAPIPGPAATALVRYAAQARKRER